MASDDTQAKIIAAAGPIFAERGFRDATVREICDAAGVGLASVNYHFRDKQQLYVQVVETAFDEHVLDGPPMPTWPPGTPVETRLREWIERLTYKVTASPKDSWQDRLLTRELQAPTPACEPVLHKRIDSEMSPLLAILEEVLLPEATPGDRWRVALSIVGQVMLYDCHRDLVRLMVPEPDAAGFFEPPRIAEHVTRMLLAALGLAPPVWQRKPEEHA